MIYTTSCKNKDCGREFSYSETAKVGDSMRGLSPPERCPECRKKNSHFINSVGVAYWPAEIEHDLSKRCWGKLGLGRLARDRTPPKEVGYRGIPVDSPPEMFETIAPVAEALIKNLEDPKGKRVSILVGPTGTGKSTWVPYRILKSSVAKHGMICVTQPRLVTLRGSKKGGGTLPAYIASTLLGAPDVGEGQEIGYVFRGESNYDRYTKLLFMTDGILIRQLINDDISKYSVIVIDEAHEQSANMEQIFALLRYKLPLFPNLRVVIASATVDIDRFRDFFGNGDPDSVFITQPEKKVSNKTPKQIHDRWPKGENGYAHHISNFLLPESPNGVPSAVREIVYAIRKVKQFTTLNRPYGDIVVFVPTLKIAEQTVKAVTGLNLNKLLVLACHAQMSDEEVSVFRLSEKEAAKAFSLNEDSSKQRVIVATNYAETSVTLSNLRYVIDSGFIMETSWDSVTCSTQYNTARHSKAGCTQRKGRVGRIQEGECFRLYDEEAFNNPEEFPSAPSAAIAREPLDKFALTAKAAGISDFTRFEWLGMPETPPEEIERALSSLHRHGALDDDEDVTADGYELEQVQVDTIDIAKFMAESDSFACALEVATFLGFIGQQGSIFLKGKSGLISFGSWTKNCEDDLELFLKVFYAWGSKGKAEGMSKKEHRQWSLANGLNHDTLRKVASSIESNLKQYSRGSHTALTSRVLDINRLERLRYILARCLREWIYVSNERTPFTTTFLPYFKFFCPCEEPVEIDRDSAGSMSPNLEAFICVGRVSTKRGVFAKYVIRLHKKTIDSLLSAAHPLLFAKKLSKLPNGNDTFLKETNIDLLEQRYEVGSWLNLRFIRFEEHEGYDYDPNNIPLMLVEDVDTKSVFISKLTDHLEIRSHSTFRTQVVGYNGETVITSQRELSAIYENESVGEYLVTEIWKNKDDNIPFAVQVEIEPGITGILYKNNIPFSERESLLTDKLVGTLINVAVIGRDGRRVKLTTPQGIKLRTTPIALGDLREVLAVEVMLSKHDGRPNALRVDAPFLGNGIILARNLMSHERRKIITLAAIGTLFKLRVIKVEKRIVSFSTKETYKAMSQSLTNHSKVIGFVSGFIDSKDPRYMYAGVRVELKPYTYGILFWRECAGGGAALDRMVIGEKITATVIEQPSGSHKSYKLRMSS